MDGSSSYIPPKTEDADLRFSLLAGAATLAVILLAFFLLNYLNILSLSEVFPKALGWLPHKQDQKKINTPTKQINQQPGGKVAEGARIFEPSLNPTEAEGKLVDRYIVVYHLYGKIRKTEPSSQNGKYSVTIASMDGSQEYQMKNLGDDDLRTNKKDETIKWSALKPGDEIMADVSTIKDLKNGTVTTSVGQVIVVATLSGK